MRIFKSSKKFLVKSYNNEISKFFEFKVKEAFPTRIDRVIQQHFENVEKKHISFAHLQKLFRQKEISLNGKRIKDPSTYVKDTDEIKIPKFLLNLNQTREKRKQLNLTENQVKEIRSWIIYMNEEVIVLNKPPGIAVQGGTGTKIHIDAMLKALQFDFTELPRLVHRIDKETSGNLVLARNKTGAVRMMEWFQDKNFEMKKCYWALVAHKPKPTTGKIKMHLLKENKIVVPVDKDTEKAKISITEYFTLDSCQSVSLLSLIPITGRTHQLRVHCSTGLGCSILGDTKYGAGVPSNLSLNEECDKYLYLHSREISLPYLDQNKKRVVVVAPLFDYFKQMMESFGFNEKVYKKTLVDLVPKKEEKNSKK